MTIQFDFFLEYSKDMLRWSNMPYQHIKWMCVFTKKVRFLDPPQEKMFLAHFCVLAMDNLYFPASCSGYLLCGLQWISELSAPSFFSRQVLVEVNTCNEQWLFSNIIILAWWIAMHFSLLKKCPKLLCFKIDFFTESS